VYYRLVTDKDCSCIGHGDIKVK